MKAFKFFMPAVMLGFVSVALVACDNDDPDPIPPTAYEQVEGKYSGSMKCTLPEPEDETRAAISGEEIVGETAEYQIKDKKIVFESFPLNSIVTAIVGEDDAEDWLEVLGNVAYSIDFAAAYNDDASQVDMTLSPKQLKITIPAPVDNGEEGDKTRSEQTGEQEGEGEGEGEDIEITVTVSASEKGKYITASKRNTFSLNIDKVVVGDEELEGFQPLTLDFSATKK